MTNLARVCKGNTLVSFKNFWLYVGLHQNTVRIRWNWKSYRKLSETKTCRTFLEDDCKTLLGPQHAT